ncbi:hypothetical protein HYH03_011519 [Edaphochlamys debaryana]|uniref:Uncharacterized protein n=1 Tax=Edaphochlamys debaryana TaxID=47281 RepID=A0A835Y2U3_9CHLO|nr:hypothetical protein HYH03_011519 [Edaphochlamys debaryana]|eukprot:KAG2490054.1 hypothetical protein HYH03_011519 [Edaphochlamys debaryana]
MALVMRSLNAGFRVSAPAPRRTLSVVVRAEAKAEGTKIAGKSVLVEMLAEKTGMTKVDSAKAFDALFESIQESVLTNDRVTIVGFGTFEQRERKAREGRNPSTGEAIKIPASKVPAFKPSAAWKEQMNGKGPAPKPAAPAAAPKPAAAPRPSAAPTKKPPSGPAKK